MLLRSSVRWRIGSSSNDPRHLSPLPLRVLTLPVLPSPTSTLRLSSSRVVRGAALWLSCQGLDHRHPFIRSTRQCNETMKCLEMPRRERTPTSCGEGWSAWHVVSSGLTSLLMTCGLFVRAAMARAERGPLMICPQAARICPTTRRELRRSKQQKAGQMFVLNLEHFTWRGCEPWPAGTRHARAGADHFSTAALPGAYGEAKCLHQTSGVNISAVLPLLRRTYITTSSLPTINLLSIGMPGLEALQPSLGLPSTRHRRQCTTRRRRVLGSVSGFQGIIFCLCIRQGRRIWLWLLLCRHHCHILEMHTVLAATQ